MKQEYPLKSNESYIFILRSLYEKYGYAHYKMSKFEEYDLYSKNKDFLVSDGIITFTDTGGKLLALKPDVTLSIIKNTSTDTSAVRKLYYNENVYRVSKNTHQFKEIMQVGLECIGKIDSFCIYEVLKLSLDSLKAVSDSYVLDVSHLGILLKMMEYAGIPYEEKDEYLHSISEKNMHELRRICRKAGIDGEREALLIDTVSLHGKPSEVLPELKRLTDGIVDTDMLNGFFNIVCNIEKTDSKINVDFSLVEDVNYYNGYIFKGFVEGVPNSVLSGGQYDTLMKKMKRKDGAIGFAVYLDMLEQLNTSTNQYDVDAVVLYGENEDFKAVSAACERLRDDGLNVLAVNELPDDMRYMYAYTVKNGEVTKIEQDA